MKPRKDGRWQKKITLPNGKSKIFYSTAKTEKEAIKDFNKQFLEYSEKSEKGLSFFEVSDEWERQHFPTLENNSLKSYIPALRQVREYFDGIYIKDIKPYNINAFLGLLSNQGYAQKTIKTRLLVLNLIFKYAIISRYIEVNPCQYISLPKGLPKSKRTAATPLEIDLIKENADKTFGFFALFLLLTGCRRGEALALTPSDVDFEKSTILINKTVEWVGNKPYIKNHPKTDAGLREIPVPDFLLRELKKRKYQKFLFPNQDGELLHNSQVTRSWNAYRKETGIEATPHQLRHSYATILFDAGIDVKTAQKWLGHADIKTTLDIYTHLSDMRLEQSTEKLFYFFDQNFK